MSKDLLEEIREIEQEGKVSDQELVELYELIGNESWENIMKYVETSGLPFKTSSEKTPFDYLLPDSEVKVAQENWTKEQIKENILTKDAWLYRGLLAIYNLQTESEKDIGVTYARNGVGFNGAHSSICSSFATQLKSRGFLTPKQKELVRKIMVKYVGQLEKIANKKIIVEEAKAAKLKQIRAKVLLKLNKKESL